MTRYHTPVLLKESLKYLNIKPGEKYIDATVGGGGHAQAITNQGGLVLGIDVDPAAIREAKKQLPDIKVIRGNFADLVNLAQKSGFTSVSGILFDLGVSSFQLDTSSRGFSFQEDALLDMRLDPQLKVTAKDLVNALGRKELYEIFTRFAQEKHSRAIAQAIVNARRLKPITTTKQLADLVTHVYRRHQVHLKKIHPATKVFLALRIAVNDELGNLTQALPQALRLLKRNGRLVVISFHQGEDRIVKQFLKQKQQQGQLKILTKKPITPGSAETSANPRARSAKLRAALKT